MDPSHPGYPAWIASKYPEDILDEINGVFPPPRSRNAIVPAAPAPTVAAVPPALAIDPALLALAPANHQTAPAQSNVQAAALPPPPPLPLPHAAPAFIAGPALIPPPAPANQALVLDQRTLEVLTVPNDGPNQAHALAAMQPNRRFQMKPGRTWRGHTHPSYSVYVSPYSFQNLGFLILNVLSFLAQSNLTLTLNSSACAYVVGDVLLGNRRCHRCVANIGAYDQCVVVPGVRTNGQRWLSGACAGCFWGGHAEKCSFTCKQMFYLRIRCVDLG